MAYKIKNDVEVGRGLGLGNMTTTARVAFVPPVAGYKVWDSTLSQEFTWDGTAWQGPVAGGSTTIAPVIPDITARDAISGMGTGDLARTIFPPITWRWSGTAWAMWDFNDAYKSAWYYKDIDIPLNGIDANVTGLYAELVLSISGQTRLIGAPASTTGVKDKVYINVTNGDNTGVGVVTNSTIVFNSAYKDPYGNPIGTRLFNSTLIRDTLTYEFIRHDMPLAGVGEYWLVGGSEYAGFLKNGLPKKGTVSSGLDAGEGIYNLNATLAAFTFVLPVATGSQKRYMFIGESVATNNATIAVQAGENLNGVLSATKVMLTDGQVFLATDRAAGNWDVKEIGAANTPVPLHYAQRSAWASFINVPLQTVPNVSDHGNNTVAAALTNRLNLSTAMTSSTSGITVGVTDFTITQNGRYRISFELEIEDATASASYGTVVQVVKNGTLLTKAKARPSNSDTNSQYITTNPNGVISVDLIAGDVIDFRIASMNAAVSKDITGYNIDIAQEASSTVIDINNIPVNDQVASGYIDIGAMRMQWGVAVAGTPTTFPIAFGTPPASFTMGVQGAGSDRIASFASLTATGVSITSFNTGANAISSGENVSWIAIGLK